MKRVNKKLTKRILIILIGLLVFVLGISIYFNYPIRLQEGAVGTSSKTVQDILALPGVGQNTLPTNVGNNWAMVNEIVEPDGTIVQDIVNTDGTVLTITNQQNIINTGATTPPQTKPTGNANETTYNRNTF
jgi:hypothetical protein